VERVSVCVRARARACAYKKMVMLNPLLSRSYILGRK